MVEAVEKLRSEFESMKIKAQNAVDEKQRSVDLLKLQLQHQRLLWHGPGPNSEVEAEVLRLQTTLIKVQGESAGCTEKLALAELTGGMSKDEKAKLTAKLQVRPPPPPRDGARPERSSALMRQFVPTTPVCTARCLCCPQGASCGVGVPA